MSRDLPLEMAHFSVKMTLSSVPAAPSVPVFSSTARQGIENHGGMNLDFVHTALASGRKAVACVCSSWNLIASVSFNTSMNRNKVSTAALWDSRNVWQS